MMNYWKKILAMIILYSLSYNIQAQTVGVEVIINYDSLNNKIQLRWAPNDPILWAYGNQYGYTIEKYIYQRNGELLNPPLEKTTIVESVKPAVQEEWVNIVQKNDYAAIAAQSLYGEEVNLNSSKGDIFSIVNKSREQETRFSFALFAADQSPEVAKLSGLFYEDNNIRSNERYLYRVFTDVPDSVIQADTGSIYFGPADSKQLPKPRMGQIINEDGVVQVKWLNVGYENIFTNYKVQRAGEDQLFKDVNQLPVVNFNKETSKNNIYNVFVDTTATEGEYFYRVIGKDAFGQSSNPSDTLSVVVLPPFDMPLPQIDSAFTNSAGEMLIDWSAGGDIQYAENIFLERSNKADGQYEIVEHIENSIKFRLKDENPNQVNYYRIGIKAVDHLQYSMPYLAQIIDSIPPSEPELISYSVKDSLLTLSWKANQESDLDGYRIYKSQTLNAEPSLVYDLKSKDTVYKFVENISLINNKRYYYISAFDRIGNTSSLSPAFEVELPDKIPPSAPLIKNITQSIDTIIINWIPSSSQDVEKYLIYKAKRDGKYRLIGIENSKTGSFIDFNISTEKTQLSYRVVAIDSNGNEGVSKAYLFKPTFSNSHELKYKVIDSENEYKILWEIPKSRNESKINIYLRSENGFRLLKEVDANKKEISISNKGIKKADIKLIII